MNRKVGVRGQHFYLTYMDKTRIFPLISDNKSKTKAVNTLNAKLSAHCMIIQYVELLIIRHYKILK